MSSPLPGTNKAFATALQNKGFDNRRTKVGSVWGGIGHTRHLSQRGRITSTSSGFPRRTFWSLPGTQPEGNPQ